MKIKNFSFLSKASKKWKGSSTIFGCKFKQKSQKKNFFFGNSCKNLFMYIELLNLALFVFFIFNLTF